MPQIEVFADVGCPFTHVGLRRLAAHRDALGRDDVVFRVRAWPLELVNGRPIDPAEVTEEIDELRRDAASDLFVQYSETRFPASSLPALDLANAAARADDRVGERVSLALRTALFELGRDIADPSVLGAIADAHGVTVDPELDRAGVLADWNEGKTRGVEGSPHFFTGDRNWFCPSLDIRRIDGRLQVTTDPAAFNVFLEACFPQ